MFISDGEIQLTLRYKHEFILLRERVRILKERVGIMLVPYTCRDATPAPPSTSVTQHTDVLDEFVVLIGLRKRTIDFHCYDHWAVFEV